MIRARHLEGRLTRIIDFMVELRRRRVIRALLGWGIASFAVLQVYEPVMHGLHLPEWTLSFVVVVLGLGFPVTAALAWVFDLTPSGIERTPPGSPEAGGGPPGRVPRGLRLAILLLGVGAAAAAPGLVYYFVWPGTGRRAVEGVATGPGAPSVHSLAVLPFENRTQDAAQAPVASGFTDALTRDLGRIRSLRVVSRIRVADEDHRDAPVIGRELGVDAVLRGSITRTVDGLSVAAELVGAADGRRLWGGAYQHKPGELQAAEREVSEAVSRTLTGATAAPKRGYPGAVADVAPEAYDLYLRGLSHVGRDSEPETDAAIALLERSAALDPSFLPVQAGLALAYGNKSFFFRPDDPQWEEKAFAAARRALALDPDSAEAHFAQAVVLWSPSHGFPSREALAELRKALASQPSFDEAWHLHGMILFHVGHLQAGLRDVEKALELNPANTLARFRLGPIFVYQQRYEEAIAALRRVPRQTFPANWTHQMAWALLALGRLDEAQREIDSALAADARDPGGVVHAARAMLRARRGDRRGAEADIGVAGQAKGFGHFHHTAYAIGAVYATLGQLDEAQEWIEVAARTGFPNYAMFETDPNLGPLRGRPRFQAFLAGLRREWERIPGEDP
jgi:TolB-like protein